MRRKKEKRDVLIVIIEPQHEEALGPAYEKMLAAFKGCMIPVSTRTDLDYTRWVDSVYHLAGDYGGVFKLTPPKPRQMPQKDFR